MGGLVRDGSCQPLRAFALKQDEMIRRKVEWVIKIINDYLLIFSGLPEMPTKIALRIHES
jgi:hypothetical protein